MSITISLDAATPVRVRRSARGTVGMRAPHPTALAGLVVAQAGVLCVGAVSDLPAMVVGSVLVGTVGMLAACVALVRLARGQSLALHRTQIGLDHMASAWSRGSSPHRANTRR